MGERKTVSESKTIFNREFPFVVPAVYRRLVDELIVELTLLNNHEGFEVDGLFGLGLKNIFEDFTNGYKPEAHKSILLSAICKSTSFSYEKITETTNKMIELTTEKTINKIKQDLTSLMDSNAGDKNDLIIKGNHYSRIAGIGIYALTNQGKESEKDDNDNLSDSLDLAEKLGYSKEKVQRDINLYKANKDKVVKALELIEINIKDEKRRMERQSKT